MKIAEINCKSILTKSGIEGVDYALNPYIGCGHGCVYCHASFMKRFTGHKEEWGTFVDVRVDAAEVLARQMRRTKTSASPRPEARPEGSVEPRGNIAFGTVT